MKKQQTKGSRRHLASVLMMVIAVVVVIMGGSAIYFYKSNKTGHNVKVDGMFIPNATAITDFKLTDNKGNAFTKANLQGHWTMMFFGFTNCGMVCPTTLSELKKMYQALQKKLPANQLPMVVMVSVDPERDTVERMNEYVTAFDPHFIGAVGDENATEALKKQLHIVSGKMKTGSNQYTINHSAEIMLFNPEAKLQAYLAYPHTADQMTSDYIAILAATS